MIAWLKKNLLLTCLILSLLIHLIALGAGAIWDRDRESSSAGIIEFDYYQMARSAEAIEKELSDPYKEKPDEKAIPPEVATDDLPPPDQSLSTSLFSSVPSAEEKFISIPDEFLKPEPPTREELLNDYIIDLGRQIDAQINYPDLAARMSLQGSVVVTFTLNRTGKLISLSIPHGGESKFDTFNREALRAVRRASANFSAFTDGLGEEAITFQLPVSFTLH